MCFACAIILGHVACSITAGLHNLHLIGTMSPVMPTLLLVIYAQIWPRRLEAVVNIALEPSWTLGHIAALHVPRCTGVCKLCTRRIDVLYVLGCNMYYSQAVVSGHIYCITLDMVRKPTLAWSQQMFHHKGVSMNHLDTFVPACRMLAAALRQMGCVIRM